MIVHREPWIDGIELQIVNGDDIMHSYRNNSKVSSCMSNQGRWRRAKFWSYVPDLRLIRAMRDDVLLLRAFLWLATDYHTGERVRYLDKIYTKSYPYDYCRNELQHESYPEIKERFVERWEDFADVRSSARTLFVKVAPHRKRKAYPMTDRFFYISTDRRTLFNRPIGACHTMLDHVTGRIHW